MTLSSSSPNSSNPADFATFLPPATRMALAQLNADAACCAAMDPKREHYSPDEVSLLGFSVKAGSVAESYGHPEWNQSWFGHHVRRWPTEEKLAATRKKLIGMTHAPYQKFSELPVVINAKQKTQLTQIDAHLQTHVKSSVLRPSRFLQFPAYINCHNTAVDVFNPPLTTWANQQLNKKITEDLSHNELLEKLQTLGATEPLAIEIVRACLSRIEGLISGPHFARYINKAKANLPDTFQNTLDQLKRDVETKASIAPETDYALIKDFLGSDFSKTIPLRKLIDYLSDLMEVAHGIGIGFIRELKEQQTKKPDTSLPNLVKEYDRPGKNTYPQAYEICQKLLEDNYESWENDPAFPKLKATFETWVESQRRYCDEANTQLGDITKQAQTETVIKRKMGDREVSIPSLVMDRDLLKLFAYVDMPAQLQEKTDDEDWDIEELGGRVSPFAGQLGQGSIEDFARPTIVDTAATDGDSGSEEDWD